MLNVEINVCCARCVFTEKGQKWIDTYTAPHLIEYSKQKKKATNEHQNNFNTMIFDEGFSRRISVDAHVSYLERV